MEVSPETTVSIQVYASDVSQAQGVSIRLVYDAGQVVYDGTDPGDLFPNAQVLVETGTNPTSVTLGVASMGAPSIAGLQRRLVSSARSGFARQPRSRARRSVSWKRHWAVEGSRKP